MNKNLLLTLFGLFAFLVCMNAQQTFTITGTVTDNNGERLPGVNVLVKGSSLGAATDINGMYLIKNVPAGTQTFSALHVGYDTEEKSINILDNQTVNFQLTLGVTLEGLVVTAQKREQSIKDIPTALTSLSNQFIKDTGQSEISELASYIPGLEVQVQSPNNPGFVIRGITSDDGASNIEPRVSIFQDGVSISKSRGSVVEVFDMERIEVLKGPQGTLFGRGAQIGAVHFIQNKPKNYTDAGATLGLGNTGYKHAEGFVNIPIVKNQWLFRTAGIYKYRDGFIKNLSGGTLNGKDTKAVRASLGYRMTPKTNITLIYNYQNDTPPGTSFKSGTYKPKGGDVSPTTFADLEQGENLGLNRTVWGFTLLGRHHFTPNLSLTSTSAYREFDSNEKFDADGTAAPALFFGEEAFGRQFSQELRMNFNIGNKFQSFAGANYFHENGWQRVPLHTDERSFLALVSPLAAPALNPLLKKNFGDLAGALSAMAEGAGLPDAVVNNIIEQLGLNNVEFTPVPLVDNEGNAALPNSVSDLINFTPLMKAILANPSPTNPIIGQVAQTDPLMAAILTQALSNPQLAEALNDPTLKLLQAPLSKEHSEYYKNYGNNSSYELFADGTYAITRKLKATAGIRYTFEDIESGYEAGGNDVAHLGLLRQAGTNLLFMPTTKLSESKRFNSVVGRAALNYSIDTNWETYATFARGRRPNVIQFNSAINDDGLTSSYSPRVLHDELVDSYEAGIKGLALNNSLYMDAALYYYEYAHFQTSTVDPQSLQFVTKDAGDATSYGFETSLQWQITPNLRAFGNYAYIHAQFDDEDSEGNKQEYAGNTFRLTPENSFALGFDASFGITRHIGFFIRPMYQYKSKVYFEEDNTENESQEGYGLLNLRAGFRLPQQHLILTFFMNNLLNEKYIIDAGNTGRNFGIPTYIAGSPRMFGVELTYNLK